MKKRVLSLLLAAIMVTGTMAGCGSGSPDAAPKTDKTQSTEDTGAASAETESKEAPAETAEGTSASEGERTKISVMLESSETGEPYKIWSQLYEGYIAEKWQK